MDLGSTSYVVKQVIFYLLVFLLRKSSTFRFIVLPALFIKFSTIECITTLAPV